MSYKWFHDNSYGILEKTESHSDEQIHEWQVSAVEADCDQEEPAWGRSGVDRLFWVLTVVMLHEHIHVLKSIELYTPKVKLTAWYFKTQFN